MKNQKLKKNRLIVIYICIGILLLLCLGYAFLYDTSVREEIEGVNISEKITDENLELAILDTLDIEEGEILTQDDMEQLSELEVDSEVYGEIGDLSGLEYATNLEKLDLASHDVTNISALVFLTNLEYVDLSDNRVYSVPEFNDLSNLEYFNLSFNYIDVEEYVDELELIEENNEDVDLNYENQQEKPNYEVTLDVSPADSSEDVELSGDGVYKLGEEVTLGIEILEENEYEFLGWEDTREGEIVSEEKNYSFNIEEDSYFIGVLEEKEIEVEYSLEISIIGMGEVDIDPDKDEYKEGEEITLEAIPSEDFIKWKGDIDVLEDIESSSNTFSINDNISLEAHFEEEEIAPMEEPILPSFTLTYTAGEGGWIEGSAEQSVDEGDDGEEVEAIPDKGYYFVEWDDGIEDNPRQDTNVTQDIDVKAEFQPNEYELTLSADPSGVGEVIGAGTYEYGQEVTIDTEIENPDKYELGYWEGEKLGYVGHGDWVFSVSFSPCSEYIISGGRNNRAEVWNVETGERELSYSHTRNVNSASFSSCGDYAVSGGNDDTVRVLDVDLDAETLGEEKELIYEHDASVRSVSFSSCGNYIVSGSVDGTVRVLDVDLDAETLGEEKELIYQHEISSSVRSVSFSPCDEYVLSGGTDNTVRIWDVETGGDKKELIYGHNFSIGSVSFSSCGNYIAFGHTGAGVGEEDTIKVRFFITDSEYSFDMPPRDLELTANFSIRSFEVVFEDKEGTELKTESVKYGESATPPSSGVEGHEFSWDQDFDEVTEDMVIVGEYVPIEYEVSLLAEPEYAGEVFGSGIYEYDDKAEIEAIPNAGYQFDRWFGEGGTNVDDFGDTDHTKDSWTPYPEVEEPGDPEIPGICSHLDCEQIPESDWVILKEPLGEERGNFLHAEESDYYLSWDEFSKAEGDYEALYKGYGESLMFYFDHNGEPLADMESFSGYVLILAGGDLIFAGFEEGSSDPSFDVAVPDVNLIPPPEDPWDEDANYIRFRKSDGELFVNVWNGGVDDEPEEWLVAEEDILDLDGNLGGLSFFPFGSEDGIAFMNLASIAFDGNEATKEPSVGFESFNPQETIEITGDKELIAYFEEAEYELNISPSKGGYVESAKDLENEVYSHGDEVELKAKSYGNFEFSHWSGDVDGIEDPESSDVTMEMISDVSIKANFEMISPHSLSYLTDGRATDTPTLDLGGVEFTGDTSTLELQGHLMDSGSELLISNPMENSSWVLNLGVASSAWESNEGHNFAYDDPSGRGGLLSVNPEDAHLSSDNCSVSDIDVSGISDFSESESINLITAGKDAPRGGCEWSYTGVGLTQTIPDVPSGDYELDLVLTVIGEPAEHPSVTTVDVEEQTEGFKFIGEVTSDGGADVTERGFCFSEEENFDYYSSECQSVGEGLGSYELEESEFDFLRAREGFVRAYAKNLSGHGYGEAKSFEAHGFLGGNCTSEDPFKVGSLYDLELVGSGEPHPFDDREDAPTWDLDCDYVQVRDIDVSETADPEYNDGKGWEGIGEVVVLDLLELTVAPEPLFKGTYDGGGYEISNLHISSADEVGIGLFSAIGMGAHIKNLELKGVEIDVVVDSDSDIDSLGVGTLVGGASDGKIENVRVDSSINVEIKNIPEHILEGEEDWMFFANGGIVGGAFVGMSGSEEFVDYEIIDAHSSGDMVVSSDVDQEEILENVFLLGSGGISGGFIDPEDGNVIIERSSSSMNIDSVYKVGGLIGATLSEDALIKESFSTGDITGSGEYFEFFFDLYSGTGGIVGTMAVGMDIRDVYSTGDITGGLNVGGILGDTVWYSGSVENTYSTGKITSLYEVGEGYELETTGIGMGGIAGRPHSNILYSNFALNSSLHRYGHDFDAFDIGRVAGRSRSVGEDNYALEDMLLYEEGVEMSFPGDDGCGEDITVNDSKKQETYESVGWDFDNVWNIDEGESYPYLRNVSN